MAFDKVDTQVDFPALERDILALWERTRTFDRLRQKNRGKPHWSFLDGPITANNPMGVHHAWGRTYKDAYQRYFAMTGHELRYQNGFDCQGLWVEVEVEKDLELKSKRDIENLIPGDRFASIDRFVQLCKDRVDKYAKRQTEQSIRLGYWMDWDRNGDWQKPPDERRSYFTMSEENNYTIWTFLKKCHERGLFYRGYDSMPWCPRCAVGLSQMEMHEGYQMVAHRAVFVRFPLRGRPGENLLVWTTTPWTLSSNVGAAVNRELTYLKVQQRDQIDYVAKGAFTARRLEEEFRRKEWVEGVPKLKTVEQLYKEKGPFEIVGELSGADMIGWSYDGPFDELPAENHPGGFPAEIAQVVDKRRWAPMESARELHRVIAWDMVGEKEGTGIVHIAPGCGKEDFALGKTEGLVPVAPLDEEGVFLPGFGELEGKQAVAEGTVDWILANLQEKGRLFAVERYPHSYPHCWRCKTELLFRLVDEWFINMSWRDEIMRVCYDASWIPDFGLQRELDWLRNMGDWMLSKKRYWGLALPIWVCESCGHFDVIGSREELKDRAVAGWEKFDGHTPHRPWIDLVKTRCPKCGGEASRIPDVGNPWLDAGIVPYSTMGYNRDRAYWEQWFPADFVTESFPGQFRNWFYAMLAMSTMMESRAPFKTLLGHALVRDEKGEEMHKSKGNSIPFDEAADKMSADLMRWMFCRHNPVQNVNFGYKPAEEIRNKFVLKLWNTYSFFCTYARLDHFDPAAPQVPIARRPDIDRWILSDLQLLVQSARREFERFNVMGFCLQAEQFVDDRLSNWYVRRNRRRFWKSAQGADKQAAYQTLYTVLMTVTKLFAPVMPFLTESMYRNLSSPKGEKVSVHLEDFPEVDEGLIDADLSADMDALLRLVSLGSAARNSVKIKVRQPLAEMRVQPADDRDRRAVERFAEQICDELNIKKVELHEPANGPLMRYDVRPNMKTLGPKFGPRLKEVQSALAAMNPVAVAEKVQAGQGVNLPSSDGLLVLEPSDVTVQTKAPEGWAGVADRGTQVLIDARITPALAREGMAREVVRQVQDSRKNAELEPEDRIALRLETDSEELRQAIQDHRDYIAAETLTVEWPSEPLAEGSYRAEVKVEGQPLVIELRRVQHANPGKSSKETSTNSKPPKKKSTAGSKPPAAPKKRAAKALVKNSQARKVTRTPKAKKPKTKSSGKAAKPKTKKPTSVKAANSRAKNSAAKKAGKEKAKAASRGKSRASGKQRSGR
jgi:isoleucyl-tRNA synthetase